MSESPEIPPVDAGELKEQLRALEARFGELRGRL